MFSALQLQSVQWDGVVGGEKCVNVNVTRISGTGAALRICLVYSSSIIFETIWNDHTSESVLGGELGGTDRL
jgi:hypothetical protein